MFFVQIERIADRIDALTDWVVRHAVRLVLPNMLHAGYNRRFASGIVCGAGTLGTVMSPSIILIVLADLMRGANAEGQSLRGVPVQGSLLVKDIYLGTLCGDGADGDAAHRDDVRAAVGGVGVIGLPKLVYCFANNETHEPRLSRPSVVARHCVGPATLPPRA